MKNIQILLILLLFHEITFSQQKGFYLKANVKDSTTSDAVANASVVINGTTNATLTDNKGNFSLWIDKTPSILKISHLGYQEKFIKIESHATNNLNIVLSKKINLLRELSVNINKPIPLNEGQPLYIKDYEFSGDKIIALAYNFKTYPKAFLYIMNQNGDTLCSAKLKNSGKLYKDCFKNNHFITNSTVWQLLADSSLVSMVHPEDIETFNDEILPLITELNGNYFFEKYYYHDQLLQYYYYDKKVAKLKELKVIMDKSKLFMLRDRERIIDGSSDPAVQERFEDLAFYKPVFAPLIKLHDTICIFDFTNSKIEFYSDSVSMIKEIPISFHNNKYWKREIFLDDVKEKVYTLFRKDGISTIQEINLKTGELANSSVIPELPFIDKIKINNDNIYFLYTEHNEQSNYKKLYRMKI